MWIVACQDGDPDADWISERLHERGFEPLEVVTSSVLAHHTIWEHRIDADGVRTRLRLQNGQVIDSAEVHAALNRLVRLTAAGYQGATEKDREYAGMELHALALSWLEGMGPRAMNRTSPVGLAGAWRPPCHWRWLARAAGARSVPYASADGVTGLSYGNEAPGVRTLLVVDGQPVPEPCERDVPAVDTVRLAAALGLDIFEATLMRADDGEWELADVNPVPSLWRRGEVAVAAVAEALHRRSELDDSALRHSE